MIFRLSKRHIFLIFGIGIGLILPELMKIDFFHKEFEDRSKQTFSCITGESSGGTTGAGNHPTLFLDDTSVETCFTPGQACVPLIIERLEDAKNYIWVMGYSFTNPVIGGALVAAQKRGVNVRVLLDHSQEYQKSSRAVIVLLVGAGIDVRFDRSVRIAHNKVIIIDGKTVLTGSYNWTTSAEKKNAENLLFISSSELAHKYGAYFEERWKGKKIQLCNPFSYLKN